MDVNNSPTKGNLMQIEKTLKLSRNGYQLMDRKRMILMNEIMTLVQKANNIQTELKAAYSDAYDALYKAASTIGLHHIQDAAENVSPSNDLVIHVRSVMGSEVPNLKFKEATLSPAYSFVSTSLEVDHVRIAFDKVKDLQLQLAEVENAAYRLANNIQKTQKRVNALQNITIPQLESVQKEISSALEEKEREEFTRLKVVKRILGEKDEAENARIAQEEKMIAQ